MERFKFLPKNKINQLPEAPGVYAFRGKRRTMLLYVGKAVNIKARVKQHKSLLAQAEQLGYIETGSEIAALLLEARLIKKYQPRYNTIWKDDKNYFYVAITKEPLPRLFITHQLQLKINYIGPFVDGTSLKQTLKLLRKVFPYYTQNKHPAGLCSWCHLNLCPGFNPDIKEYQKNIKNLIAVLKGGKQSVLRNLKKEMTLASKSQNFEKAAEIKNQITALEKVMSHSVKTSRWEAYDVSNIQGQEATGAMVTFINGRPDKNFYRRFKIKVSGKPNDVAMMKEIISRRLKHAEWPYPDAILIDGGKPQLNAALLITKDYKLKTKIMALAKKHNELFIEGKKKPVLLKPLPQETSDLILRLRDEAHRFAISYHKKLRFKNLIPHHLYKAKSAGN